MGKLKAKTHKGLQKRVRVTGRGKVKRNRAFRGHLFSGRPSKRRRRLRQPVIVTTRDAKRILEELGLGRA